MQVYINVSNDPGLEAVDSALYYEHYPRFIEEYIAKEVKARYPFAEVEAVRGQMWSIKVEPDDGETQEMEDAVLHYVQQLDGNFWDWAPCIPEVKETGSNDGFFWVQFEDGHYLQACLDEDGDLESDQTKSGFNWGQCEESNTEAVEYLGDETAFQLLLSVAEAEGITVA